MYEYRKKTGRFKRTIIAIILMIIASVLSIFIYSMYVNTDVYSKNENTNNYSSTRLSQNIAEEKEQDITSILENTIKCVVGISKIKNTGNSIFLNNSTQELGLGTGMIITDNRIYTYKLACSRK